VTGARRRIQSKLIYPSRTGEASAVYKTDNERYLATDGLLDITNHT